MVALKPIGLSMTFRHACQRTAKRWLTEVNRGMDRLGCSTLDLLLSSPARVRISINPCLWLSPTDLCYSLRLNNSFSLKVLNELLSISQGR